MFMWCSNQKEINKSTKKKDAVRRCLKGMNVIL